MAKNEWECSQNKCVWRRADGVFILKSPRARKRRWAIHNKHGAPSMKQGALWSYQRRWETAESAKAAADKEIPMGERKEENA